MSRTKTSTIALRTTKLNLNLFKNIKSFSKEDYIYNLREDNLLKKLLILVLNQYFCININKLKIIKYFESIDIFTELNIDKNTQKLNLLKFINEKNTNKKLSLILYNKNYINNNIINKKKIILYNNLISKQLYSFNAKKLILNKLLILNYKNKKVNLQKKNNIKKQSLYINNTNITYILNLYNIYYYFLTNTLKNYNITNLLKNSKFIYIFFNIFNKIQSIFFKNNLNFKILKNKIISNVNIKSLLLIENNTKILNKTYLKNIKNNLIILFQLIFNYYNLKNNNKYKIFYKYLINDLIFIYLNNSKYNLKKNITNYTNIYLKNYYILLQFKTNITLNYFNIKYLKTKLFNINKLKSNNIKILVNNSNINLNIYNKVEIIPTFHTINNNTNNLKFLIKPKNKYFQTCFKNYKLITRKLKNQLILKNNKNKYYKIFIIKIKKIKYLNKKNRKFKNKLNFIKKSNYLKKIKYTRNNLNYYFKNNLTNSSIKNTLNSSIIKNRINNKSVLLLKHFINTTNSNKLKKKFQIKNSFNDKIQINNCNKIQFLFNYRILIKSFIKTKYISKILNLKYILNKQLNIKKSVNIQFGYLKRNSILYLNTKNYIYKNTLFKNYYFNNKKQFIIYRNINKQLLLLQLKLNNKYFYNKQYLYNTNLDINNLNLYKKITIFKYYLINSKNNFNEISKKIYFDFNTYLNNKHKKPLINNNQQILKIQYLNNKNILLLSNFQRKRIINKKYLNKFSKKHKINIKHLLNKQYKLDSQNFKNINLNLLKKYYKILNINLNLKKNTINYYHFIFKFICFNKNLNSIIKINKFNNLRYYIILNNLFKIKNNLNINNFIIYYNNIKNLKSNNILFYLYSQKLLQYKINYNTYQIVNYNIIYNYFNYYLNYNKININNKKFIHISYQNFVKNSKINIKKLILKNKIINLNYSNIYNKINKKIYNFKDNLKIKNILLKQLYNLKYLYLLNKFDYFDLHDYNNLRKNQFIKLFLDFNFLTYSKTNNNIKLFEILIYPLFNKHLVLSYKKQLIKIILNFEQLFKIINYFKNLNSYKLFSKISLININNSVLITNNYNKILTSKFIKQYNSIIFTNFNKFQKYSKNFEIYKHYMKKISKKHNLILSKKQLIKNYTEYKFNKNINKNKIKKQNLIYKQTRTINNLLLFYNFLCTYKYQKYLIKKILKKLNLKINISNNFYFIQKKYIKYLLLNNYITIYKNLNYFFLTKLNTNNINPFNKLIYKYSSLNSNYYYYTDLLNIFNKNNIVINNNNEYNILYPDLFLNVYLKKVNYTKIKNFNQKLLKTSIKLNTNIITNNYLNNIKFSQISKNIDYAFIDNILYINNNINNNLINKLLILHKKHLNNTNLISLNININSFFYIIIKNYYLFSNQVKNKFINTIISKKNILLNYIFNNQLYVNLYENQEFIDIKQLLITFNMFIKYLCFLNIYYILYKNSYIKFYNNYNIFNLFFFSNFLDYVFKKSNYLKFLFYKLSYKNNNLSKVIGLYLLLYKYNINPKLINIDIILNYIYELLNIQIKSNLFYKFSNLKKNLYLFENIFNDFIKISTNIIGIQFSIKGKTSNTTLRKKKYIIQKGYLNLNNINNLIDYSQKTINGKYGKLCFRLYISTNILR